MNTTRVFAVGKVVPDIGTVIVTEQDALGTIAWSEFLTGINSAIEGVDLEEMTTADMVSGWWWAVKRNGAGEPDYAIEDDNDWHSRGEW